MSKIIVTGGAGFIGSNIVEALLMDDSISLVRVIDNFATGFKENIKPFFSSNKFEFIEGDIRDKQLLMKSFDGIDIVCHQAALGSVPRSINNPFDSHDVNVNGFFNVLDSARLNNVKKVLYASSSSVYGDIKDSPKIEYKTGRLLSPYAATKMCNEIYAQSFSECFSLTTVGFRYFNVFGPRQNPNGDYAAVIPKFILAAIKSVSPLINGDGEITRDFTPVKNIVAANLLAIKSNNFIGQSTIYNVACGQTTSLNKLWDLIKSISKANVIPVYGPMRKGDILSSLASIEKIKNELGFEPNSDIESALSNTIQWYQTVYNQNKYE